MTEKQKRLNVTMDGITVQHAGELLFDATATSGHRRSSWETYLRSLEDFAFSLVYGTSVSVSGSLPKVGNESPGQILIDQYKDWFIDAENFAGGSPEEMINIDWFRQNVKNTLSILPRALDRHGIYWKQFIYREAENSLVIVVEDIDDLDKKNLLRTEIEDPGKYEYRKTPPYIIDRELQNRIPVVGFLEPLAIFLKPYFVDKGVSHAALIEFISRATLTHMVIYWWYECLSRNNTYSSLRVPHITRTLLHFPYRKRKDQVLIEYMTSTATRHALWEAIRMSAHRGEVADRLGVLSQMKDYEDIREQILNIIDVEAHEENREIKEKYVNKILKEISAISNKRDVALDQTSFGLGFQGFGFNVSGSALEQLYDKFVPTNKALRAAINFFDMEDYMRSVSRVFPELEVGKR